MRQHLNKRFLDHWIGHSSPFNWPTQSPHFKVLDYYLWSWFQNKVYKIKADSQDTIIQSINNVAGVFKGRYEKKRRETNMKMFRSRWYFFQTFIDIKLLYLKCIKCC